MSNEVAKKQETGIQDLGFMDSMEAEGMENFDSSDIKVPRLLISQALSQVVQNGTIPAGHFYNSLTSEDYGTSLRMVIVHYEKQWIVRDAQGKFKKAGPCGFCEVKGDSYVGMTDNEGNKVSEVFSYVVVLPYHPEAGYIIFQSAKATIKYLKALNTMIQFLKLDSGKQAPIFAGVWELSLAQLKTDKGTYYTLVDATGKTAIKQTGFIDEEFYNIVVKPAREIVSANGGLISKAAEQADVEETETVIQSNY